MVGYAPALALRAKAIANPPYALSPATVIPNFLPLETLHAWNEKFDIAGIGSPLRMTRRTLRLAHGCAKKPNRHQARQALALR
jgi:hypothetical protein